MSLDEFCQRKLESTHVKLELEFFGTNATAVNGADIAHRRDRERGIERCQVLLGGTLGQLEEPALPKRSVVIFGLKASAVGILQKIDHGESLGADAAVLNPGE